MNHPILRRLLDTACRIYTITALSLCCVMMLFATEELVIHPLSFFMLFPFALCFAGANLLYRSRTASAGMRLLGHFSILTVGVVVFVFLPAGVFANGSTALVMSFTYLLLYLLIMLAVTGIRTHLRRHASEETHP